MSRFNLVDEKWIPVRFPDGTREELGIRAVLLQAKKIASIENASPLVVAALHRFLLAVLYRALEGPSRHRSGEIVLQVRPSQRENRDVSGEVARQVLAV